MLLSGTHCNLSIPQRDSEAEPEFRVPVSFTTTICLFILSETGLSPSQSSGAFELMSLNGFKEVVTSERPIAKIGFARSKS